MVRRIIPDVVQSQKLLKLRATATVREAAIGMAKRNVRSVLVANRGKLEGIFTGTDLIGRVVAKRLDPDTTSLRDVMTKDPETVAPDDSAIEALRRMHANGYRHLPIVENGKLVGILSRRDFLSEEEDELEREERLWERL
jgi:CBS domain-containing protein